MVEMVNLDRITEAHLRHLLRFLEEEYKEMLRHNLILVRQMKTAHLDSKQETTVTGKKSFSAICL